MKSLRKRACFLGRVLALSPFLFPTDPVEPQDAHGSPDRLARSVVTGDGSRAEVITADTVLATGEMSIEYAVEGLAHTGPSGRDTLLWLAGTPGDVVRQLLDSGMMAYSERRSLRIASCTGSVAGCAIGLTTASGSAPPSFFRAFRTLLLSDGTLLSIDNVVQRDAAYYALLRDSLGVPETAALDQWLWTNGFWSDEQSFVLMPGTDSPWLVLGFPSWEGRDTLLTVWLPIGHLTTATAAMMD